MTAAGETEERRGVPLWLVIWIGLGVALLAVIAREALDLWPWWVEATDRRPAMLLAEVLVPGLVGVGGIAVAIASWWTSASALRIARDAEQAEAKRAAAAIEREDAQQHAEYEIRLNNAIVLIARSVEKLVWEYEKYFKAWPLMTNQQRKDGEHELMGMLIASSQEVVLARMVADRDDRLVLEAYGSALQRWTPTRALLAIKYLIALSGAVVEWRLETHRNAQWKAYFDAVTPAVDAQHLLNAHRASW